MAADPLIENKMCDMNRQWIRFTPWMLWHKSVNCRCNIAPRYLAQYTSFGPVYFAGTDVNIQHCMCKKAKNGSRQDTTSKTRICKKTRMQKPSFTVLFKLAVILTLHRYFRGNKTDKEFSKVFMNLFQSYSYDPILQVPDKLSECMGPTNSCRVLWQNPRQWND